MREGSSAVDRILRSPLTWFITAINAGIFLIAERHGDTTTVETLVSYGACERILVQSGDYWRLLTYMFLHIGWLHLLWNSWVMFGWCADIERTVGSAWFAFAYLTTGIGAGAVSVLSHDVVAAGASGSGFGMIAVILALLYRRSGSWSAFLDNPSARNLLFSTVIWVVIGFSGTVMMDNFAHLGGFAFGFPCGLLLESRRGRQRSRWLALLAVYGVVWVAVVAAACVQGLGFHWGE